MSKFSDEIKKRIDDFKAAKGKVARVGVIKQQHYDDGTPVAYVAAIHEYGSLANNIPARPFFRPTISKKKNEWSSLIKKLLRQGRTAEDVLELVGMVAAGDVVESISKLDSPPLALSTKIARNRKSHKGGKKPKAISIKPLVDTGLLISSITNDVVDKEEK